MPGRKAPLVEGETYHVFNRGIDRRPTFTNYSELERAQTTISYYRFNKPPIKLAQFLRLSRILREEILSELVSRNEKLIEIMAFCFMSNHFHFLLKQLTSNGISKFLSQFQNSYTRYFNIKHERIGPLFLDQFKAVRMETEEQLLHVSRYIHLNPLTSFVVKDFEALVKYKWSSFPEYLNQVSDCTEINTVLSFFKNKSDYREFVSDQANYQRQLHIIRHLIIE